MHVMMSGVISIVAKNFTQEPLVRSNSFFSQLQLIGGSAILEGGFGSHLP